MNIVIPIAGEGIRFSQVGISTPKPLIKVFGKTLLEHSLESLGIDGRYILLTKEYENKDYQDQISSIIKSFSVEAVEIRVTGKQHGSAHTILQAAHLFEGNELITTNGDQRLFWNAQDFMNNVRQSDCDGAVVLHKSYDTKNSFAKIADGKITEIKEKQRISTDALIGIHYWKNSNDFIQHTKNLLVSLLEDKELYVSEVYNPMIDLGQNIMPYFVQDGAYVSLGTPADISAYTGNDLWKKDNE